MNESQSAKPRRRWLPRFSLRTLLILVLLAGSGFGLWWKWEPWAIAKQLDSSYGPVLGAEYSPDGSLFLTFASEKKQARSPDESKGREVTTWDAKTLRPLHRVESSDKSELVAVRFTESGRWITTGSPFSPSKWALFDPKTGDSPFPTAYQETGYRVALSKDEKWAFVCPEEQPPELWDLERRERHAVLEGVKAALDRFCFSNDSTRLAIGEYADGKRSLSVFDCDGGRRLHYLDAPMDPPFMLTPDGEGIIGQLRSKIPEAKALMDSVQAGSDDVRSEMTAVCLWDLKSGKLRRIIAGYPRHRLDLLNGRYLALFRDKKTQIRDANTLDPVSQLEGSPTYIPAVSADGQRILTASVPLTSELGQRVWFAECDFETGAVLRRVDLPEPCYEPVQSASYQNEDRRVVAITSRRTIVWDSCTGANRHEFACRGFPSPDGRRVLLWEKDQDLKMGDMSSGALLASLDGTTSGLTPRVSFDPSGERVLLTVRGDDSEAQVWERRRPEWWWGVAWLPEFWLTLVFALLLVWSLVRDFRTLRRASA